MRDAIRTEAFRIRIASFMFVLSLCTVAVTQIATQQRTSSSSAPKAMINVLASREPHPSLGEEAQTFDRFVGTWDAEFTSYRDGGKVYHRKRGTAFRLGTRRAGGPGFVDCLPNGRP